jgi:hypothetical protein
MTNFDVCSNKKTLVQKDEFLSRRIRLDAHKKATIQITQKTPMIKLR